MAESACCSDGHDLSYSNCCSAAGRPVQMPGLARSAGARGAVHAGARCTAPGLGDLLGDLLGEGTGSASSEPFVDPCSRKGASGVQRQGSEFRDPAMQHTSCGVCTCRAHPTGHGRRSVQVNDGPWVERWAPLMQVRVHGRGRQPAAACPMRNRDRADTASAFSKPASAKVPAPDRPVAQVAHACTPAPVRCCR